MITLVMYNHKYLKLDFHIDPLTCACIINIILLLLDVAILITERSNK